MHSAIARKNQTVKYNYCNKHTEQSQIVTVNTASARERRAKLHTFKLQLIIFSHNKFDIFLHFYSTYYSVKTFSMPFFVNMAPLYYAAVPEHR